MNVEAILSEEYQKILDTAHVSHIHEFDGRDEFGLFFEEQFDESTVIWSDGEFHICDPEYDDNTVILYHQKKPVGFYFNVMSWLDPEYRGKDLGVQMILNYANHFGDHAFKEIRKRIGKGMGFSPRGYRLHLRALDRAMEIYDAQIDSPGI